MDLNKRGFPMAQVPAKRKRKPTVGGGELAQEVAYLFALGVPALRARWTEVFGVAPSPSLGRRLLARAIAYALQERAFGGLKLSTDRLLDRADNAGSAESRKPIRKPRAAAGTVLIREWGGVGHRVTVREDDVVYAGRHYKSLSEVARAITGARWSGPLFFGLRERAKEEANG
jgi:hypothetical protein